MKLIQVPICILVLASLGCGEPPVDPTIAQAVQTENKTEKARKGLAAAEAKQQAEIKAAKDQVVAAREAELSAAVKLPAELPKTLDDACDAFVKSYDGFMKRGKEKDVLQWWDGRRRKLGEHRASCVTRGSVQLAACGSHALTLPLQSLSEFERTKAAQMVLQRCDDEFGKS